MTAHKLAHAIARHLKEQKRWLQLAPCFISSYTCRLVRTVFCTAGLLCVDSCWQHLAESALGV